jgi:hypothetical protein
MSLRSRLDALEKRLSFNVPKIMIGWPPLDGVYTTETGGRVDWEGYVRWHIERGFPRPIQLKWPEHKGDESVPDLPETVNGSADKGGP